MAFLGERGVCNGVGRVAAPLSSRAQTSTPPPRHRARRAGTGTAAIRGRSRQPPSAVAVEGGRRLPCSFLLRSKVAKLIKRKRVFHKRHYQCLGGMYYTRSRDVITVTRYIYYFK
ncbi:hypothetical protein DAI22_02g157100 [Oryza sativa Japonica Group]|nr:hypothetical protein DAI22_02g157100 [Oryza sativa Japonica Group]